MGKIRVRTIGDEEQEIKQAAEAKKRAEVKKTEKRPDDQAVTEEKEKAASPEENKSLDAKTQPAKTKKEKFKAAQKTRSSSYQEKASLLEKDRQYSLSEAVALLPQLKRAKFDETVELHLTTLETGVSGSVTLPHGTGKTIRVQIADGADQKGLEDLIKKIESGNIEFDILVATPDAMPKLARTARILGPKGLMPNPKNGTVTPKPDEVAKKYEAGQINFKTEAKAPLLHIAIGKVSFEETQIKDNAKAVLSSIDKKQIKNATLKSTMSPAIHLDVTSL